MKRLIGRLYSDETVQADIKRWPFRVNDDDGYAQVQVTWNGKVRKFKPEQISAIIVGEMKTIAEEYLDRKITSAVITVPAYFNDFQRQTTMDAGKAAGLTTVYLLNEPTAAALAYAVKKHDVTGTLLIFDLGGGTLDVSIVNVTASFFTVKTTQGDTHLGGQDFTNRLFDYMKRLCRENYGQTVTNNKSTMARLKHECEVVKKRLSFAQKSKILIQNIMGKDHFNVDVTREKFCELNQDLFKLTLKPIETALRTVNMAKSDIDKVIMVGGSSRIPEIKTMLSNFFCREEILTSIHPDEAIASGAAIYAAIQDGIKIPGRDNVRLEDVIPRSLGIGTDENFERTCFIIKKNSTFPICKNDTFTTLYDDQTSVRFPVYEGESSVTQDNILLGEFKIKDIPPRPKGEEQFDVQFAIDSSGILKVSASNISTKKAASITISRNIGSAQVGIV